MLTLSHMINPVKVKKSLDLYIAQPVAFETMRRARDFCLRRSGIEVTHLTAQYPQDRTIIPEDFKPTADLERSILDIGNFNVSRKLPLIKDILDRLYHNTFAGCEYLIYTNVDIALQPYFYWTVSKIIEQGYDAFIINRRTIPDTYKHVEEIPLMYSELGEKHKGWDCFIFKRSLYPEFDLGTACIGMNWIGRVMITNMACLAKKFKIFENLLMTFHIGNERSWKSSQFDDYTQHNKNECKRILIKFEKKYGPFNRSNLPGRFFRLLERTN